MTDLSKRLREWGQPKGYPVCVFPDDPDVVGDRIVPARDMMEMWTLMARAADALDQPAWRPIAEAPMDGTPVMLAHIVDKYVLWACAAEWGTALPGYIQCASYSGWFHRLPVTTDPARGPGEFAATGDIVARDCYPPTHFMPLPTPPEDV